MCILTCYQRKANNKAQHGGKTRKADVFEAVSGATLWCKHHKHVSSLKHKPNTLFNVLKNASLFNISKPISKKKKKINLHYN